MKIYKYIAIALTAATAVSCDDFLKEYSQDTAYVSSWEDLNELLIGDCYMPVEATATLSFSTNYGSKTHYLADEIQEYTSSGPYPLNDCMPLVFGYYTWQSRTGQNPDYTGYYEENRDWTELYKLINVANNVIESVDELDKKSQDEIKGAKKVEGEARFLRAFYYFFLANLYGKPYMADSAKINPAVPIKTSAEVEDTYFTRNSVEEVYQLVINDLTKASQLLNEADIKQKSIYRADSTAANLLLSRVYLYKQDWKKAVEYADKVINSHPSLQNLNTNTARFSQLSNVENIFSMGGNDLPCAFSNGPQSFMVDINLYDAYTKDDLRKSQWFWKYSDFVSLKKFPTPPSQSEPASETSSSFNMLNNMYWESYDFSVSSLFLLRSAEAYLNKAEALAYLGRTAEAKAAVNTVRKARINKLSASINIESEGDELIRDIREERRKELVLEGHRWFDLRRYMVCEKMPESKEIVHNYSYYEDRLSANVVATHKFTLSPYDPAYTLPIPQEVIDFNTGMTQNYHPWRNFEDISTK